VSGGTLVGGLVGRSNGTVTRCHATGAVTGALTGSGSIGGLVGFSAVGGTVEQCYASGAVSGEDNVGGLAGYTAGAVRQCYATGAAAGKDVVGGLVGFNAGTVEQCYATGAATGVESIGGVAGKNYATLTQCYATGAATGAGRVGGVAGQNYATLAQSYWDTETSGLATSAGGEGRTTAQMQQQDPYVDWDFANVWDIVPGQSYPYLQWSPPPFTVTLVANGPGNVSADLLQASYPAGAVVTLRAVADAGAEFVRWSGPVAMPGAAQTTVTVAGRLSLVGHFRGVHGISSVQELQKIGYDPAYPANGRYWLTGDVDAAGTATWNDAGTDATVLEGFRPLGTAAVPFTGELDGRGYVIRGLTVNRASTAEVGLFGWLGSGGTVRHLGLEGGSVTGANDTGGLVGRSDFGTVERCYAAGAVNGHWYTGGLVGYNRYGTVAQCYAAGAVTGDDSSGGLLGRTDYGTVTQCAATGTVSGADDAGGLVGMSYDGTVAQCYATGAVTGDVDAGGLLGRSDFGSVTQCYAAGAVSGEEDVGGLVGRSNDGTVTQCYAKGAVTGDVDVGGLVGHNLQGAIGQSYATGAAAGTQYVAGLVGYNTGTVEQCYATGAVTGGNPTGGLLGYSSGTVEQCYWDTERSGRTTSAGGEGRTTAQMRLQETYAGWDFASLWGIAASLNDGCAYLRRVGPWLTQFLAAVGAAEVSQGRGLWDITGTYPTSVAGYPLTLHLVHESTGRLTGTAVLEGVSAGGKVPTPVNLTVRGAVRTAGGKVLAKLTLQGTDSARTVRAALALDLTLDVGLRQVRGPARGTLRTAAGMTPVTDEVALALPAAMDGTWTLFLDLARQGRADSGTALLTLSNGAEQLFAAVGRSSGPAFVLSLSGAATDPAAKGIGIRATAIPSGGGWARLEAFATLDFGQRLGWR
jgi:hypothetical protein